MNLVVSRVQVKLSEVQSYAKLVEKELLSRESDFCS